MNWALRILLTLTIALAGAASSASAIGRADDMSAGCGCANDTCCVESSDDDASARQDAVPAQRDVSSRSIQFFLSVDGYVPAPLEDRENEYASNAISLTVSSPSIPRYKEFLRLLI